MASLPTTSRELVTLACAASSYASAYAHLMALRQVGVAVPDQVVAQVGDDMVVYAALWAYHRRLAAVDDLVGAVADARTYLAEHQQELDEVLEPGLN